MRLKADVDSRDYQVQKTVRKDRTVDVELTGTTDTAWQMTDYTAWLSNHINIAADSVYCLMAASATPLKPLGGCLWVVYVPTIHTDRR